MLHHVTSAVGNAVKVSCELECVCTGIEFMFTVAEEGHTATFKNIISSSSLQDGVISLVETYRKLSSV